MTHNLLGVCADCENQLKGDWVRDNLGSPGDVCHEVEYLKYRLALFFNEQCTDNLVVEICGLIENDRD